MIYYNNRIEWQWHQVVFPQEEEEQEDGEEAHAFNRCIRHLCHRGWIVSMLNVTATYNWIQGILLFPLFFSLSSLAALKQNY